MTGYVDCPHCRVRYPLERLYGNQRDQPTEGRSYTIVCSVCGGQFDVSFQRGWSLRGRTLRASVTASSPGARQG